MNYKVVKMPIFVHMKRTSLNISLETKDILKSFKLDLGYKTYSELINEMVSFFRKNQLRPNDDVPRDLNKVFNSIRDDNSKNAGRIIKILRRFEIDYFRDIHISTSNSTLEYIKDEVQITDDRPDEYSNEQGNDIVQNVDTNKLIKQIEELKSKNTRQQREFYELQKKHQTLILLSKQVLGYMAIRKAAIGGRDLVTLNLKDPAILKRHQEEFKRLQ